jgi:hypothetical protein
MVILARLENKSSGYMEVILNNGIPRTPSAHKLFFYHAHCTNVASTQPAGRPLKNNLLTTHLLINRRIAQSLPLTTQADRSTAATQAERKQRVPLLKHNIGQLRHFLRVRC